jgi:hypothetical protein
VTCPDDGETKVEIEIDLSEITVQMSLEHSQEVELTKDIKLRLRYPILKDMKNLDMNLSDFERSIIMFHECVESVVDGDEIINRIDMTTDEIVEFIDSFNTEQLENVLKFFETDAKINDI